MILLLLLFICNLISITVQNSPQFDTSLKYYEILRLENIQFNTISNKQKFKRDINIENSFLNTHEFKFNAYGRTFHLILKKDTHLLSESINIEVRYSNNTYKKLNDFYTSNYYIGIVKDELGSNVFLYYDNESLPNRQSLLYGKIELQNDVFYIEPSDKGKDCFVIYRSQDLANEDFLNGIKNNTFCQSRKLDDDLNDIDLTPSNNRPKRETKEKNRCNIALVADWRFFASIGNSNEKLTTLYMINLIGSINSVFTKTEFDENHRNFGFNIENIVVHAEPYSDSNHYNSYNSYSNADTVLELFGAHDWSQYCLAHLFTFNKFDDNVLGLAYVASPRLSSYGGICSKRFKRKGDLFSANTGLSSHKSTSFAQNRLLQREAELVTVHELGHNWGAEHDPNTDKCTPKVGGYFVMYPYANQGYDENNYKFSPCSRTYISEVLKVKSSVCFKEESKSFCGNNRIEEDEECDGGLETRRDEDKCCNTNCKLRSDAKCSDKNHDCCRNCQIASNSVICFNSISYSECFEPQSFCDGFNKTCPRQQPKQPNTTCNSFDSGRCDANGHCLSLCQQININLIPCKCSESSKRCIQCCQNLDKCLPLHEIINSNDIYWLSNGRTCIDGICENRICKNKVKDYVNRFWTIIENIQVNGAVEFFRRNIVLFVVLVVLVIWTPVGCMVHFCIDKKERARRTALYQQIINNHPNVE